MQVKNFDFIRVGEDYPASIDLLPCNPEYSGIAAIATCYRAGARHGGRVRLLFRPINLEVALVTTIDDEAELPSNWAGEDIVVLWDSIEYFKNAQEETSEEKYTSIL